MKLMAILFAIMLVAAQAQDQLLTTADDTKSDTVDFIHLSPHIDSTSGKMSERFIDAHKTHCIKGTCSTVQVEIIMGIRGSARMKITWLFLDLSKGTYQIIARQHYMISALLPPKLMRTEGSYRDPLTDHKQIEGDRDMTEIANIIKSDPERFEVEL